MSAQELTEEFRYLDELRESGRTNMFGAGHYLKAERDLDRKEADRVLGLWMRSFDAAKSAETRAAEALASLA